MIKSKKKSDIIKMKKRKTVLYPSVLKKQKFMDKFELKINPPLETRQFHKLDSRRRYLTENQNVKIV